MLADMGADVIKIEKPGEGDDTRHWGPPFMQDAQGQDTAHASYFTACNRNKRSIAIDIAKSEGQTLIKQLALQSDILVENFKVGGLAHYGLDYASVRALNPRMVYCSITGFGQTGPYAERAGYDLMIQAMSGMMSITGKPEGTPGGSPQRVGVALTDLFTGVYACSAILAAIEVRHRTGLGQHIDMSLLDVGMAILANQAAGFLNTGQSPRRQGNSHPSLVPYRDFETLDSAMLLAIGNDGQFARFCTVAGHPEWATDTRFSSNIARIRHRDALEPMMQTVTRTRTTAQWIADLEHHAVPCGPINSVAEAFADAQVSARGLAVTQPTSEAAQASTAVTSIGSVASPLRLGDNPPVLRRAPPSLGEHTDELLQEWGWDADAIARLRAQGVVG
jgi:formyl-CoA transferase